MPDLFVKDPSDVRDYTKDWTLRLVPREDTIVTSDWSVTPDGLTIDDSTNDDLTATVWLSGGSVNALYQVANLVTTEGGRTYEESIFIRVEQR